MERLTVVLGSCLLVALCLIAYASAASVNRLSMLEVKVTTLQEELAALSNVHKELQGELAVLSNVHKEDAALYDDLNRRLCSLEYDMQVVESGLEGAEQYLEPEYHRYIRDEIRALWQAINSAVAGR